MAWEALHDPDVAAHLDMEAVYDLSRRAGYSEAQSQEAARLRGLERLRRNLPA